MRYRSGRDSPVVGWLLLLPVPLATLGFGAVHASVRACVFTVVLLVAAAVLVRTPAQRVGRGLQAPLAGLAAFVVAGSAVPLFASGGLRETLQPGFADAVSGLARLSGVGSAHLALDPDRGWLALGSGAASVLFALAVGVAVRSRRRSLRLATGLVATALATVVLQAVHATAGWTEIYGASGVSAFSRYPSFGSFVSHNHGAALLAAALPLAVVLLLRPHREWRWMGGLSVLVLVGGLVWAQSRGAALSAAVALAVLGAVAGGRSVAVPVGVFSAASVGAVVALGAERAVRLLSQTFMPGALDADAFGNRRAVWAESWQLVADAPLVGVGPGGFRDAYKLVKQDPAYFLVDHAHHEPLQALVEHGVLLGSAWCLLPLVVAMVGVRKAVALPRGRRRTLLAGWLGCLASLSVACLFDFPLRVGALGLTFAAALGAVLAGASDRDEDTARGQRAWVWGSGALLGLLSLPAVVGPLGEARAETGPTPEALWEDAVALEAAGASPAELLRAVSDAARAQLVRRPLDHGAAVWVVRSSLAQEDLEGARDAASALVTAYPTLPAGWLLLAEAEAQREDRRAARLAWRAALALDLADPSRAPALIERALAGEASPADAAKDLLPDRADRLSAGGVLLARQGDRSAAQALLERAAALEPASALPLAHWLLQWGDAEAASAALDRGPRSGCRARLLRGRAAKELGGWQEAATAFRRARAVCTSERDRRTAELGGARVALAISDRAAFEAVEAVLLKYPDHHGLRRDLIDALHRAGRYDESVPHLDMLVLDGVANGADLRALERITQGLPPL